MLLFFGSFSPLPLSKRVELIWGHHPMCVCACVHVCTAGVVNKGWALFPLSESICSIKKWLEREWERTEGETRSSHVILQVKVLTLFVIPVLFSFNAMSLRKKVVDKCKLSLVFYFFKKGKWVERNMSVCFVSCCVVQLSMQLIVLWFIPAGSINSEQ